MALQPEQTSQHGGHTPRSSSPIAWHLRVSLTESVANLHRRLPFWTSEGPFGPLHTCGLRLSKTPSAPSTSIEAHLTNFRCAPELGGFELIPANLARS